MRRNLSIAVLMTGLLLSVACSSSPPRLYVLSSLAPQNTGPGQVALVAPFFPDTSRPTSSGRRPPAIVGTIAVAPVHVPQYLDRPEIVVRKTANELQALENDRWAEPLGANATRAFAENLTALLPQYRIWMLPSRTPQRADYEVSLEIAAFEVDERGTAVLVGDWNVVDAAGVERAGTRAIEAISLGKEPGGDAIAAAMSRNLAELSAEIAQQINALPTDRRSGSSRPATGRRAGVPGARGPASVPVR